MKYLTGIEDQSVLMATEAQLRIADTFLANLTEAQIAEAQAAIQAFGVEGNSLDELYAMSRVRIRGNTAIVPLQGLISKRPNILTFFGMGTSADLLTKTFLSLKNDDRVKHVVVNVNSGGGSVQGIEIATRALRELSAAKDTRSIFNEVSASAAYYISSAARRRYVTPSSTTGSIGTLVIVPDLSEAWKAQGIEWKVVRSAEFKALLNGKEPVTEKALKELEKSVNKYHADFVNALESNLNISNEQAQAMADGRTHEGTDAIEAGLADAESTLEDILASIDAEDEQAESFRAALEGAQANIETLQSAKAGLEAELESAEARVAALEAQIAEVSAAGVTREAGVTVDAAIADGKIPSQSREKYIEMAVEHGVEFVAGIFADMKAGAVVPTEDINEDREVRGADEELTEIEAQIAAQFPSLRG